LQPRAADIIHERTADDVAQRGAIELFRRTCCIARFVIVTVVLFFCDLVVLGNINHVHNE